MKTNPSKMDMDQINLGPTEWFKKFTIISNEELELLETSSDGEIIIMDWKYTDIIIDDGNYTEYNNDNNDNDDDDDDYYVSNEYRKKLKSQFNLRMIRMAPLFASQPRLKKICKDWDNSFLPTCFKTYVFNRNENDSVSEIHEKANDLKYLINLCGSNLTSLDVTQYPISQIMPIINANCPNLVELSLAFKEIMSQDFENVFSNMSHLTTLSIEWQCKNTTLPMTLAKSLEKIGGTLKSLNLSCTLKGNDIFSPDSLASVFPRLSALKYLTISGFGLSQLLLQSIGEMKNLINLRLYSLWPKNHPMFDTRINMYPIGNLKNLEKLWVDCDYSVRDEFLINLSEH
ncbi:uncharacterized protein LOC122856484 [Aphidius gifuensis]|uniref:uncharacterized protein LOC122856484 n=1 Tax=Aphidius gifuensis TaxID=684658 RepID=UPI001CDCA65D|nr:uncharacterized protein LOC122856484 [Aphidius gifuensis]